MRTPRYGNAQTRQGYGVGSTIQTYDPNSWGLNKELLPDPDSFNPLVEYTSWQLDRYADAILWRDTKTRPNFEEPVILLHEHLHERRKREVYVASGTPDQSFAADKSPDGQMMYWRTHPQGRKLTNDRRASYYR